MKKLLLLFALISLNPFFSKAQETQFPIQPKTWSIGGSGSFTISEDKDYQTPSKRMDLGFNLRPNAAFAIGENLMLGMGLSYFYNENSVFGTDLTRREFSAEGLGIFPFVRKYFDLNNQFGFHLTGELGYERSWLNNYSNIDNDPTNNAYSASIRPGVTYFITKHIALEAQTGGIFYTHSSRVENDESVYKSDRLSASLDLTDIYFGINFFF